MQKRISKLGRILVMISMRTGRRLTRFTSSVVYDLCISCIYTCMLIVLMSDLSLYGTLYNVERGGVMDMVDRDEGGNKHHLGWSCE